MSLIVRASYSEENKKGRNPEGKKYYIYLLVIYLQQNKKGRRPSIKNVTLKL